MINSFTFVSQFKGPEIEQNADGTIYQRMRPEPSHVYPTEFLPIPIEAFENLNGYLGYRVRHADDISKNGYMGFIADLELQTIPSFQPAVETVARMFGMIARNLPSWLFGNKEVYSEESVKKGFKCLQNYWSFDQQNQVSWQNLTIVPQGIYVPIKKFSLSLARNQKIPETENYEILQKPNPLTDSQQRLGWVAMCSAAGALCTGSMAEFESTIPGNITTALDLLIRETMGESFGPDQWRGL